MPGHISEEMLKLYNEALQEYRDRNFNQAKDIFEKCLEIDPDDGPSKLYVERCDIFIAEPPPEDWDGVFVMTSK